MFALWCVDQNLVKRELTTSVIGILFTPSPPQPPPKIKDRKMLNVCGDSIQFIDSLCMLYGYNGLYENPKSVHFIFVNN